VQYFQLRQRTSGTAKFSRKGTGMDIKFEPLKGGAYTQSGAYQAVSKSKKMIFLAQYWYCRGPSTYPDPIETSVKARPILSYYNGEATAVNGWGGKKFDDALETFFLARVVKLKRKAMQARLEKEIGVHDIEIPFKKYIIPKYQKYNVTMYTSVKYAHFRVTWPNMKKGHWVILSLPRDSSHSLYVASECLENGGTRIIPPNEKPDLDDVDLRELKPKTKTARRLLIVHKRAVALGMKEKIKELEEKIKELEAEAAALESD